jgi:hypothetical protein
MIAELIGKACASAMPLKNDDFSALSCGEFSMLKKFPRMYRKDGNEEVMRDSPYVAKPRDSNFWLRSISCGGGVAGDS